MLRPGAKVVLGLFVGILYLLEAYICNSQYISGDGTAGRCCETDAQSPYTASLYIVHVP